MPIIIEENNRNLLLFLIITFLFSWILWLPSLLASIRIIKPLLIYGLLRIIGSFGPFVAAFTLTYINDRTEGMKILWTRGWHYGNWRFLIISIFLLPLISGLSLWLAVLTEGTQFPELRIWDEYMYIFIDFIFFFFIAGPFQEEFGWRGYALDKFQSQWFSQVTIERVVNFSDLRFVLFADAIHPGITIRFNKTNTGIFL